METQVLVGIPSDQRVQCVIVHRDAAAVEPELSACSQQTEEGGKEEGREGEKRERENGERGTERRVRKRNREERERGRAVTADPRL